MMSTPRTLLSLFLLTLCVSCQLRAQTHTTWQLDNLPNIGGHATTVIGDPTVIDTPFGKGVLFDGNDGLIIDDNPIADAKAFTMEMIFRPDPTEKASSNEPRVFHVEVNGKDHRAISEIRVDGDEWYLDAFLKSGRSTNPGQTQGLTLIDPNIRYPLGEWYNYTITYDGTELRAYLDGALLLSGPIDVIPLSSGQTSLGMRHTRERFFEGAIAKVRFTDAALEPADFIILPRPDFQILNLRPTWGGRFMEINWTSVPESTYTIERTTDLQRWTTVEEDVPSKGHTTTSTDNEVPTAAAALFYRILLNDPVNQGAAE